MFTLIGKTNIDFVGKRYLGFALSGALMILGFYGFYRIASHKAKLAIDFSGGTAMKLFMEKVEPVENLRQALKAEFPDAEIQQIADQPQYLVKLRDSAANTGQVGSQVAAALAKNLPANKLVDSSSEEVGPAVSG
ncbi:MAG: protein translocase subunit SecF, partial [candidate division FCPU426 bacterium]